MSSGIMLAKACTRAGYHIFADNNYPSLIRGGHNVVSVRVSIKPFYGMNKDIHILAALNTEAIEKNREALSNGALVLFDPADKEWKAEDFSKEVRLLPLPLREIVSSMHADTIMRNTIALGATVALMGISFDHVASVIHDQFIRKGQEVVDANTAIAKAGYEYIREHYPQETSMYLTASESKEQFAVVNGSEAVGLGAVRAGLKFAAIYPMTPINALITFLADHSKEFQIVYKQPEDEVAGINMAIGASIGGVRSMVATSGGGFALMVEGLSLAGMIEVPLVIDLGMRVGPATGMPTYTEQGELLFAIHSGHGEFARIVLAPSDATEAFELTIQAFHLADKYQIPVFVLTDKYLNESQWTVPVSSLTKPVTIDRGLLILDDTKKAIGEFQRFDPSTPNGVSTRSVPGTKNGLYYANSYEHDGTGHMTDEAAGRKAMADKRLRKCEAIKKDIMPPTVVGDEDADITFVTWGTTFGIVVSASELLRKQGKKVSVVAYPWIYPFPIEATKSIFAKAKRIIGVEQNATAQLAQLIRTETGIIISETILKYDGRPLLPEEIVEKVTA